ncbi:MULTISPECIES: hypothetical protein [Halomonadaceae]|nr:MULTISPECIES: hypothetical protein [Halomonas]
MATTATSAITASAANTNADSHGQRITTAGTSATNGTITCRDIDA